MLTDTHAHIYTAEFDEDRDEMLARATAEGIGDVYMPNIDSKSLPAMLRVADQYPWCHPMIGLHPCHVDENYRHELDIVEKELCTGRYAGIGETGIDLYWDKSHVAEQEISFRWQVAAARQSGLPVIIHSRDSMELTISIIKEMQDGSLRGIFHCFNGTVEQGLEICDLGFFMGIGGVITYKNAGVDKVVAELPLANMVLETDAPYLSPVPYRGKRNECSYIGIIARKLAEVKEVSLEKVAEVTGINAGKVFGKSE